MEKLKFKDPDWPEELAKLLSFVNNETGVFPVIAGGAVRDGILGGEVRDIDIYVDEADFNLIRDYLFQQASYTTVHQRGSEEYDHQYIWYQLEDALTLDLHEEFPLVSKHPINLIGVKAAAYGGLIDGTSLSHLFNLSTSQCWIGMDCTFGWELGYSQNFRISVDAKLCRILRTDWGHAGTKACALKFLNKYPDFALDIPNTGIYRSDYENILSEWVSAAEATDFDVFDL